MLEKSFGLFFFLKTPKNQKSDERYIYLRITIDGIPKELSTKRMWPHSRWDQNSGRAKGNKEDALSLNHYLETYLSNVYRAKSKLLQDGKEITAEILKNHLIGKGEEKLMLLKIFKSHNDEILSLVGRGYAYRTFQRYRTTFDHTAAFLNWKYSADDLELKELGYGFAKDFSIWLKTIKNCNHNSAMKYISTLNSVLIECRKKKWLKEDPFSEFKTSLEEIEIVPLYQNELKAIEKKHFNIERLELVKDIFLFSCYTGLAYVDVSNLRQFHICEIDGEKWIVIARQKTGTPQRIPLLDQPLAIIEKYKNHERCKKFGAILPILTNQKMNSYLKEIADSCGIEKKLTFHIARHTFATTVTLANGVPIETVSSMLGHKRLTQTQHYAKIVDVKKREDMLQLRKKLTARNSSDEKLIDFNTDVKFDFDKNNGIHIILSADQMNFINEAISTGEWSFDAVSLGGWWYSIFNNWIEGDPIQVSKRELDTVIIKSLEPYLRSPEVNKRKFAKSLFSSLFDILLIACEPKDSDIKHAS